MVLSETMMLAVIAMALLIIAGLSGVAWHYTRKLRAFEQEQREAMDYLHTKMAQQRSRRVRSIRVIAQGIVDEQLTLTEGAIRLSALLTTLEMSDSLRESYKAFFLLAEAAAHIPVLEDWKALSTKKKLAYDRERQQLEQDHREFVLDAARRLANDARFQDDEPRFYPA